MLKLCPLHYAPTPPPPLPRSIPHQLRESLSATVSLVQQQATPREMLAVD